MSQGWNETLLSIDAEMNEQIGNDFCHKYNNHRSFYGLIPHNSGEIYHGTNNSGYLETEYLIKSFDKFCRDYNLERKLKLTVYHHDTREPTIRYDYIIIDGVILPLSVEGNK